MTGAGARRRGRVAPWLAKVYRRLFDHFGPQHWWPAETPFETVVGAVLTQSVSWRNVERAIANLKSAGRLDPHALLEMDEEELASLIVPTRFYRQKARRLRLLADILVREYGGSVEEMLRGETALLRERLLSVPGIGPETADTILLYAGDHPVFVVDAYTRRVFSRLGLFDAEVSYDEMQATFMQAVEKDARVYNEYHALIVAEGKQVCTARSPRCPECPLADLCEWKRAG